MLASKMDRPPFDKVTTTHLLAFAAAAGLFFTVLAMSEPGFVFLIDHANLLFHEAGHVFIGLVSQRCEPYGGTLGQLVFPVVLAVSFWRKGQSLSIAGAVIWFFENWLNIARYMADARTLTLTLVGGGDHDWNTIFNRWNLLSHDTEIAFTVKTIGWLGMIAPCVWVVWRYWQDRHRSDSPDQGLTGRIRLL